MSSALIIFLKWEKIYEKSFDQFCRVEKKIAAAGALLVFQVLPRTDSLE